MGQTLSPYRRQDLSENEQPASGTLCAAASSFSNHEQTAGGSSSGSAAGVAAGFCPLAIATETAGSTVYPASCNGLYGMKLTPGSVPNDGVFRLSESVDAIGIMARDAADLAALAEVLQTAEDTTHYSLLDKDVSIVKSLPFVGLSIGVVSNTWGLHTKDDWITPDVVSEPTMRVIVHC